MRHDAGAQIEFEPLHIGADLGRVLVAQLAILFEAFADNALQLARDLSSDAAGAGRRFRIASKTSAWLLPRNGITPVAIS